MDELKIADRDLHLLPLEPAARILAALRGVDPDHKARVPHPEGLAVMVPRSAWLFFADELLVLNQCLVALRMAQQGAEPPAANEAKIVVPH